MRLFCGRQSADFRGPFDDEGVILIVETLTLQKDEIVQALVVVSTLWMILGCGTVAYLPLTNPHMITLNVRTDS